MALITEPTNLDYLITPLRLHINDATSPYTYNTDNLRTRLVIAVKALAGRWNNKYLINNDTNNVERNPYTTYLVGDPPVVQHSDERSIVLRAAIDIKSAALGSASASNGVKWKDDEVSFDGTVSVKFMEDSLLRDIEELNSLLPVAGKRLAATKKQSLPGFQLDQDNDYEG